MRWVFRLAARRHERSAETNERVQSGVRSARPCEWDNSPPAEGRPVKAAQ